MLNRLIEVSAQWDWVTPIHSMLLSWARRPTTGFYFSAANANPRATLARLCAKGVNAWGLLVTDGIATFRVRDAQADYTRYLLGEMEIGFWTDKATPNRRKP